MERQTSYSILIKQHILHMTMEKNLNAHKIIKIIKINFYFLFFVSKIKIKIRGNKNIQYLYK